MPNKDIIKGLSSFSKISENRLTDYLKDNQLVTLFEHPETISPTENQLKNLKDLNKLRKNYEKLSNYREYVFEDTLDSISYLNSEFETKFDKEHFIVAFLDKGNKLLGTEKISTGTLNASIVHPRDVFKQAIQYNADRLILAHNHPSGDPKPSNEDLRVTTRLEDIAKILNKEVIDHIIFGRNDYFSFKQEGIIENNFELKDTRNIKHEKIYKNDIEKNINLLNQFTGITKTELKNILKENTVKDLVSNPESFLKNNNHISKIKMLNSLNKKYKEVADYYNINSPRVNSPNVIDNYVKTKYKNYDNINIALYLDTKNKIIESVVLPKNLSRNDEAKFIFEKAFLHDSNCFILSTKSTDPLSYNEDNVARIMYINDISKIMGIKLLDNIEIDKSQFNSFQSMGIMEEKSTYKVDKKIHAKETTLNKNQNFDKPSFSLKNLKQKQNQKQSTLNNKRNLTKNQKQSL